MQEQIEESAFRWQREVESGERVIVGVNRFATEEPDRVELHRLDPAIERAQRERLQALRAGRDAAAVGDRGRRGAARGRRPTRTCCPSLREALAARVHDRRALRRAARALGHVRRRTMTRVARGWLVSGAARDGSASSRCSRSRSAGASAAAGGDERRAGLRARRRADRPRDVPRLPPRRRHRAVRVPRRSATSPSRAALIVRGARRRGACRRGRPRRRSPRYVGQDAAHPRRRASARTLVDWARASSCGPGPRAAGRPSARHRHPRPRRARGSRASSSRCRPPIAQSGTNGSTDDYRCFLLDPSWRRTRSSPPPGSCPGDAAIVHHVILYRIPRDVGRAGDDARPRGPGTRLDVLRRPGVGGGTSGNPRGFLDDAGWIAAWAPGFGADRFRRAPASSFRPAAGS